MWLRGAAKSEHHGKNEHHGEHHDDHHDDHHDQKWYEIFGGPVTTRKYDLFGQKVKKLFLNPYLFNINKHVHHE